MPQGDIVSWLNFLTAGQTRLGLSKAWYGNYNNQVKELDGSDRINIIDNTYNISLSDLSVSTTNLNASKTILSSTDYANTYKNCWLLYIYAEVYVGLTLSSDIKTSVYLCSNEAHNNSIGCLKKIAFSNTGYNSLTFSTLLVKCIRHEIYTDQAYYFNTQNGLVTHAYFYNTDLTMSLVHAGRSYNYTATTTSDSYINVNIRGLTF